MLHSPRFSKHSPEGIMHYLLMYMLWFGPTLLTGSFGRRSGRGTVHHPAASEGKTGGT